MSGHDLENRFLFIEGRGAVLALNFWRLGGGAKSIYWIWHSHIYMGLGTYKNSEHRLHIVSGTWKNFEFSPFIWALGLGKIPRPSFLLGSETWKNFKLCLYIGLYRLRDLENSKPEPPPRLWASI